MRTRRTFALATYAVMVLLIFSGVAPAHHGRSGYAPEGKEITLKGIITELRWKNPHVYVLFNVKNDNGKVVEWMGELSSVETMISQGMSRTTLKPGEEITIIVRPAVSGTSYGLVSEIIRADGKAMLGGFQRYGPGGDAGAR